jgi:hypothetical protein
MANSMTSVSPVIGLLKSQRPTMLQVVSSVITTTTTPATMAQPLASQSNTFSTVISRAVQAPAGRRKGAAV